MNSEQIYQDLIAVAERINIKVVEKALKKSGIRVESGLCRVHGDHLFIMEKKLALKEKIEMLASCIAKMDIDSIYVLPTIRELLNRYSDHSGVEGG